VIREWTANAPDSQGVITINTSVASRVLMRIAEPQSNHNGGGLAFGPDKYLYITLGDGGGGNDNSGGVTSTTDGHTNQNDPDGTPDGTNTIGFAGHGNGQDRRNVYGKILRIKPTTDAETPVPLTSPSTNTAYRIPNDNPFTPQSNPSGNQIPGYQASWVDEIYAMGLRNPFRMGFDRSTGKLYTGDVGQDTREEVDLITKGGNYGWVAREGLIQNPSYPLSSFPNYVAATGTSFVNPIADYYNDPNGNGGTAVIGGYVYRGGHNPALDGKYVFGDLSHSTTGGRMMYMSISEPGPNQVYDLAITGARAKPTAALHGIAEDANGELYYLFDDGQIIRPFPAGDYNFDGQVNNLDYGAWRAAYGTTGPNLAADGNGNGIVDAADYVLWRKYAAAAGAGSSIPEPTWPAHVIALLTLSLLSCRRQRTIIASSDIYS
jgi:glucose/arabinose dehydrogenase